jgi:hypothetical protein
MASTYHFQTAQGAASNAFERALALGLIDLSREIDQLKQELDTVKSRVSH